MDLFCPFSVNPLMSSNGQKYRHLNTHADQYSFGACGQNFGLNLHLRKSFDYASIKLPGESRNIRKLA